MNLAALLIPPSLDAKQALRLRRFGLAVLAYALCLALVALAAAFGMLAPSAALGFAAASVAINLGLYAFIRSGFNLRFGDPSLTRVQILAAISVLMYIVYHMDDGRNIALFGCFIIFLFGSFRLDAREFTVLTLYTLAAYALVINLLMHLRPQAIHDVPLEWLSWLMLAGFLPGFTVIGGKINSLRRELRESERRLRGLTEISSDFYWESDAEHRITRRTSGSKASTLSVFQQGAQIGKRRWEVPYLSPDEAGWQAHRALLDAHQPFRDFELSRTGFDGIEHFISISGDPVFDASGGFKGYCGLGTDITERKRAEQALLESNKRLLGASQELQLLIQSSPLAIYTRDANGLLTSWNPAAETMYGWKAAEVLGKPLPSVPGEARAQSDGLRMRLLAGERFIKYELRRHRRDGSPIDIDAFLGPLRDADGKINGIIAVVADITERKRAEQALRDGAEELRLFADNIPAMTASYDEHLHCRFANKYYADFFGYGVENILRKHLREVVGEETYGEIEGHFLRVLRGHPVTYQRTCKLQDGGSRYIEVKLLPHVGELGKILGCFAVVIDITEHKLAEEHIQRVAHHDSLTGLPNRLLFNDRLEQAISLAKRDSRQFALLYLDLDRFKPVNDTLGHAAGDELLQDVVARIRHQVRESDTVARVGGDEFSVILPNIAKREEAETVAKKIVTAVSAPFPLGRQGQSVDIGTSIGIALFPADGQDADTLIKAADAAMYVAKQRGNSFRFCEA